MSVKMGIISSSKHLIKLAMEISRGEDIEILYSNCDSSEARQAAFELQLQGVEVILARGQTAKVISNSDSHIPVVKCGLTTLDLLKTIREINDRNKKFAVSSHLFYQSNFEEMICEIEKFLNTKIETFNYTEKNSMHKVLEDLKSKDVSIVLGGSNVSKAASEYGLEGKEILTTTHTLLDIIKNANNMVLYKRKEVEESSWIRAILDFSNEGILVINKKGRIIAFNNKASNLLNNLDNINSKSATDLFPTLKEYINEKKTCIANIVNLNNEKLVIQFKPIDLKDIYIGGLISMDMVSNIQDIEHKIRKQLSEKGLIAKTKLDYIIGSSAILIETIEIAKKLAKTHFNILITGESGTGKELFAQGIHLESFRRDGPFVAVNCAALPENLLESELFGYEEGAFSGARKGGKLGLFELAHKGTIFLDEINSISQSLQARLLRVVQEKEILRLGGDKIIPIDVRIIAATNYDLITKISEGNFREDLFFRLNELNVNIPPLRNRRKDIPLLIKHFLLNHYGDVNNDDYNSIYNYILNIVNTKLFNYTWPGNVRELENLVKRCIVLIDLTDEEGNLFHSGKNILVSNSTCPTDKKEITIRLGAFDEMKSEIVKKAFEEIGLDKNEFCKALGISQTTLWRYLSK